MAARPPIPDAETLHAAALSYLGRYAATQAGLLRVLHRRIARWSAQQTVSIDDREARRDIEAFAAAARGVAREVVSRLAEAGAVSDATFAAGRARSLGRAGRSRRAIAAHLAQRGVSQALAADAASADAGVELAAALIHARKRRAGPFGPADSSPEAMRRVLASFARAGFSQDVARSALSMSREEAESRITAFRSQD
jgi:regulatory protein